jgi:methylated-DNA-[protein]-cysteine S-methyltransferase
MIYSINFTAPFGNLALYADDEYLLKIVFDTAPDPNPNEILQNAAKQLNEFFALKRKNFSLPFQLNGTDFQIKVWQQLLKIPWGRTVTYQEMAQQVGRKNAARAVGNALHRNPLPIIIPCHRVLRTDGTTGGFAWGSSVKEFLLKQES